MQSRYFLRLFLVFSLILVLPGCESVEQAMTDVRMKIASIDFGFDGEGRSDNLSKEEEEEAEKEQDTDRPDNEENMADDGYGVTDTTENAFTANTYSRESGYIETPPVETSATCPDVSVLEELAFLHQFRHPDHPKPEERISSVKITDVDSTCVERDNQIIVDIDLTFEGSVGPRARIRKTDQGSFSYPYFVAVTTRNGNIMAKDVHALTVDYPDYRDEFTRHDAIRQIIPASGDSADPGQGILIGFQLSAGELAYNRSLLEEKEPRTYNASAGSRTDNRPESPDPVSETPVSEDPAPEEKPKEKAKAEATPEKAQTPQKSVESDAAENDSNEEEAPLDITAPL